MYGLSFNDVAYSDRLKIMKILGKIKILGGKIRDRDQQEYESMIEQTMSSTPYRIFQKHKKAI